MNEVFGNVYADAYDQIYGEKDYEAECDLIERIFREFGNGKVRDVVDLGCGTGNHSIPLASRGYNVTGIDRSEGMLKNAREKASRAVGRDKLDFRSGDIRNLELERVFDSALIMFAVLGYQIENDAVRSALVSTRKLLKPDGLLIFDVWYGPAVLAQRPGERVRTFESKEQTLLRTSRGRLDIPNQTCAVDYHLWVLDKERILAETQETHTMRFFFSQELKLFLHVTGFELVRLANFSAIDQEPTEATWNVICVARAVES